MVCLVILDAAMTEGGDGSCVRPLSAKRFPMILH